MAAAFCIQRPLGLNLSYILGKQNSILHTSQNCNILKVSSRCLKRCQMAHKMQTSLKENVPHFLGYEPQFKLLGPAVGEIQGRLRQPVLVVAIT